MASDIRQGNFGDSARNRCSDLKNSTSNHVFDEAGENIHYHSDSESLGSRQSKTRYINPAIYIETVEASHSVTSLQTDSCIDVVTPHPHSTYRSNSTPFLSGRESTTSSGSVQRKSCRLVDNAYPEISDMSLEADESETPRFDQTYRGDLPAMDTFRLSVASLSTTTTAKEERERNEKRKQEAFKQWLARKEQEKRDKARNEKKVQAAPAPSPEQREESYQRWLVRKRQQHERRRAEDIMQHYRQNEMLEKERNKKEREKESKLADWIRKKEEAMKAMKTKEERKAARAAIEDQRRRAGGQQAYRDWLRTSKHKPLPVPLNQGELSMRGSVSQMYINPVPWQSLS